MSYATQSRKPQPAALVGALGVPGGIAVLLIAGLAITQTVPDIPANPKGIFVPDVPLLPPPPEPEPVPEPQTQSTTVSPQVVAPLPPISIGTPPPISVVQTIPPTTNAPVQIATLNIGAPSSLPTFETIGASPSNEPGRWVTNDDYRGNWVRRGYEGVAKFSLEISASGRVTDCSITASTGHSVLDEATCKLVQRRARFEPAKDSTGTPVAGTYSNAVNWQLPD